ncbi:hypothetical protein C5E10_18045 [Pseudoclavibacter sp. RFBG4]|uniref:hypothetical protein n=1 Tax=Pseudoclavibacter sp. RFBG4 TaxID=2080575 RepID=UPI000CE752AC|nr:hypothetical protein [Pseudoclavibacter sp. RFBG4]PPG25972.1 hypothetical protein C5E10_18045 [Pseudoclavibacter sp. RFBG4]
MGELIVTPPAQKILIDQVRAFLRERGDQATVSDSLTAGRCVRIAKIGGGASSSLVIVRPWFTIETAAGTNTEASNLIDLVVAYLGSIAHSVLDDGTVIYDVDSFGEAAYNPSPDGVQKWTQTVEVAMRALVLD